MGMYTGLRFKGVVKKEYREMMDEIHQGVEWSDFVEAFPFLNEYAKQDRAEFIPRGVLCYMPNDWEKGKFPNQVATDGFERSINLTTGVWTFQCSLKNYNDEIEQFFEEVLPHLLESAQHIEYRYEEWDESVFYVFENGKIVEKLNKKSGL